MEGMLKFKLYLVLYLPAQSVKMTVKKLDLRTGFYMKGLIIYSYSKWKLRYFKKANKKNILFQLEEENQSITDDVK